MCNREAIGCQSFNYMLSNNACELNSCTQSDEFLEMEERVTFVGNTDSSYYQTEVSEVLSGALSTLIVTIIHLNQSNLMRINYFIYFINLNYFIAKLQKSGV